MPGLSATQRVATVGATAFVIDDLWNLKAAVPARWASTTTFLAHPKTIDVAYRFVAAGDTSEPEIFSAGRGGPMLGRPTFEWSAVGTQWTTTSGTIALAGDFNAGYVIADRLGLTAVPIPALFGGTAAVHYPTGEAGLAVWGRTGAQVVNPNAIRALVVA
jgi:HK97 family phage major capsid protein